MARRNRPSSARDVVQGLSGLALVGAIALTAGPLFASDDVPTSIAEPQAGPATMTSTTTTSAALPPSAPVTVTSVESNGTAPPSDELIADVAATVQGWLEVASVRPLGSARPAGDLSPYFTVSALNRLAATPTDRAALVDEGLPPASQGVAVETAEVALSTLAGPDGRVAVVLGTLNLKVHAVGPTLDVDIVRTGTISLAFQDGRWKIDSYEVRVSRSSRP